MKKLVDLSLSELISKEGFECNCGKTHAMHIERVEVGENALENLPEILSQMKISCPFVICDQHTREAAFPFLIPVLEENEIPYHIYQFSEEHLEPDETSVGKIVLHFNHETDGILAVGSGVLNDLGKVMADITGLPLATIATAPSMDGYGSNNASLIRDRLKVSLYYRCPEVIIADTRILKNAPFEMLQAGVGDMLAKYCSICEWRISHLITGEYYCENIAELVRQSLRDILCSADALLKRDAKAIEDVFIGLLYTGLAMGYAGISRPASGLEHYFSHVWEMMSIERNQAPQLHGIQVVVGTLLTFKLWQNLKQITPDEGRAKTFIESFDQEQWEQMVLRIYGKTAGETVIKTALEEGRNSAEQHAARFEIIKEHWQDILKIVEEEMPSYEELLKIMKKFSMPLKPQEIGFSEKDTHDALIASREVRNKYVTSSLLWDLGLLYEIEFPENSDLKGMKS